MSLPEMNEGATEFERRTAKFISEYEDLCRKHGLMIGMDMRDIAPLKLSQYIPYVVIVCNGFELERSILELRLSFPLLFKEF